MNWQDFFKLTVTKAGRPFFSEECSTPVEFPMHELLMSRFDHLGLSAVEKKKFSVGARKIVLCHELINQSAFKQKAVALKSKILTCSESELSFQTEGAGIYLFLHILKAGGIPGKTITVYTSELPLPIMQLPKHQGIQFIFRPHSTSYLADFSSLWGESELMQLFELKDFKASA